MHSGRHSPFRMDVSHDREHGSGVVLQGGHLKIRKAKCNQFYIFSTNFIPLPVVKQTVNKNMNHSQSSRLTVWSAFTPLDGPHTFPRAGFDRRVVNLNASPSWPFPLTGPAFALLIIDGRRWRRSWGIRA